MKLNIFTEEKQEKLGDLFGIFFEDLNHAADGGIYGELIQNRSFEFCEIDNKEYHPLMAWEKIEKGGKVSLEIEEKAPFAKENPHYLRLKVIEKGEETGVCNIGFLPGIYLEAGKKYDFTCYGKNLQPEITEKARIKISLRNKTDEILDEVEAELNNEWSRFEKEFFVSETTTEGRLAITLLEGEIGLDFISLFPKDTYKQRKNGLRKDLVQLLEELHPRFMRFPGGCLVHDGTLNPWDRNSQYRWKNTIGPVEKRPARRNNWAYNQTLGLGYYEYFELCEDIGAKPLPVIPGGYDPHHDRAAEGAQLEAYVQDALDLIEFANGDTDTKWGALRASLGHPEPFHMEYIGVGNEEIGEPFFERYPLFHQAIKEKYPEIKVIGTSGPFAAGKEYDRGWQSAVENHTDLVDEHYYQSPEWFIANHHRYDSFDVNGPKVFLGEYASQGNTWYNALAEASYMIGLQNKAKTVGLACYAPLFCNVNYVNWKPDMIWFDNYRVYGTPNYYVQKLFMNHQGDTLLRSELQPEEETSVNKSEDCICGAVVLATNDAKAEYSDIEILNEDTGEHYTYDSQLVGQGEEAVLEQLNCRNYTIRMKAKELEGFKGFKIIFGRKDEKNQMFWCLGGWANADSLIGEDIDGRNSCLIQNARNIEAGRLYELEIRVRGRKIETYVDGKSELSIESKPLVIEPLYTSISEDEKTGDVLIKLVNLSDKAQEIMICFPEQKIKGWSGMVYKMEETDLNAENSFEQPLRVSPVEEMVEIADRDFTWKLEKTSLQVLRLKKLV